MGKLYRSNNRVLAGVCAGLAEHFGFDAKLVRIITILCCFFAGAPVVAYLILWILMPEKKGGESYAERMKDRLDDRARENN